VIAYLLKYAGMSFLPALKLCQCKRPQVCPNLGFELQLKAYEKQLQRGSQSVKKKSSELPELAKYQPFSTHNNRSFVRVLREGRDSNSTLSKSLKAGEIKERKEMDCLRKMAEFRFGITNIANWKMSTGSVHKHVHF
jgi:hypothetical protein